MGHFQDLHIHCGGRAHTIDAFNRALIASDRLISLIEGISNLASIDALRTAALSFMSPRGNCLLEYFLPASVPISFPLYTTLTS